MEEPVWSTLRERRENGLSQITVQLTQRDQMVLSGISDVASYPEDFRQMMQGVINEGIQRLGLVHGDEVGLTINTHRDDGVPYTIGIRIIPIEQMTVEHVLQQIADTHPTNSSIALTMSIKFSGVQTDVSEVGGRGPLMLDRISYKRTGITQIHPLTDPFKEKKECLLQLLVLGIAFLRKKGSLPADMEEAVRWLDIEADTYEKCTNGRQRFRVRNDLVETVKRYIPDEIHHFSLKEQLQYFEDRFCVRFVLYDVVNRFRVFYPDIDDLPRFGDELGREIYGVLERGDLNHVDLCVRPSALTEGRECGRVCANCYELYSRSRVCNNTACVKTSVVNCRKCHTCVGYCGTCCTKDCGKMPMTVDLDEMDEYQPLARPEICTHCRLFYYSSKCKELHSDVCEELQSKRCSECGKADHRGLKCDEIRCLQCAEKMQRHMMDEHVCYLRPKAMKKPPKDSVYWTYDFETCIGEGGRHEIYLATAWPMYEIDLDPAMDKYEHVRVPNYSANQPVFIFWGLEGVKKLFEFFLEEFVSGAVFFAHNAGKYDSVFIEYFMNELHGLLPRKLQRGTKILQMSYEVNNITFKDSIGFIPASLRSTPKNFGVQELRKGFFPHKIMTVEFMKRAAETNFIVPKPDRASWQSKFRPGKEGEEEKRELEEFLQGFYAQPGEWDLRKDAVEYCISDTVLLGEVLRIFRKRCMEIVNEIPTTMEKAVFDVLQYVTLPSAMMAAFFGTSCPEKELSVVDRYSALMRKAAIEWVCYEATMRDIYLDKLEMFPTVQNVTFSASYENTLFLFLPCYDHGCPKCYPSQQRNLRKDLLFYKLYMVIRQQIRVISDWCAHEGKTFVYQWEHDWIRTRRKPNVKKMFDLNENVLADFIPLDPRDAYKGGMVEMYKIYHPNEFVMYDVVSMYPARFVGFTKCSMTGEQKKWYMPTGPVRITMFPPNNAVADTELRGIVKCRVVPPPQLYCPFLGYKVVSKLSSQSYEVLYGLCRTCMEERRNRPCQHDDAGRSFVGTWTINEVKYAIKLGYRVVRIVEIWEYERKNHELFKSFIAPFVRTKMLAKRDGIVDEEGNFTENGIQVRDYIYALTGEMIQPSDFKNAPVDRNTTKLMINSLYGKFGQRAVWSSCSSFTNSEEDVKHCHLLLSDSSVTLLSFDLIPRKVQGQEDQEEMIAFISFEKNYPAARGDAKKHDIIAAEITAMSREDLHEKMNSLQDCELIYCDTDSIILSKTDRKVFDEGLCIGDLEFELPDAWMWVGYARKSYLYKKPGDVTVCKLKGVTLDMSMMDLFTPEGVMSMVIDTVKLVESYQDQGMSYEEALDYLSKLKRGSAERPVITVEQVVFKTKRNAMSGEKVTQHMQKDTRFLAESMKRWIWIDPTRPVIDTLPYGYVM